LVRAARRADAERALAPPFAAAAWACRLSAFVETAAWPSRLSAAAGASARRRDGGFARGAAACGVVSERGARELHSRAARF